MGGERAVSTAGAAALADYGRRWGLTVREPGFETNSSWLQQVFWQGDAGCDEQGERLAAVLKIAKPQSDERPGMALLDWWGGRGAVPVLKRDEDAVLMVEAGWDGPRVAHLLDDPAAFSDQDAFAILIDTACRLHAAGGGEGPEGLVPLTAMRAHVMTLPALGDPLFQAWLPFAQAFDCMGRAPLPLHGDIHHGNVLWLEGEGAWVALDPKGLLGDRGYDFANLFFNPMEQPGRINDAARMRGLADQIAAAVPNAGGRQRVLDFAYFYGGMSTAWGWTEPWHDERRKQFKTLEIVWRERR